MIYKKILDCKIPKKLQLAVLKNSSQIITIFTSDVKFIKWHNNYNFPILRYACAYLYDMNLL